MTTNKSQKRAIRERMAKTGERYTTARHYHLDLHQQDESTATPFEVDALAPAAHERAALPPRVAEPGMSDDAVQRGTGRMWDEWFALLDDWGASDHKHPEIARHLGEAHGIDGWWAQSVTIGYERARGMRGVHQRPDGFTVNASKTFPVPIDRLFAAFVDDALRGQWLDPDELRPRTSQPNRSARFDVVANDTRLSVTFTAKNTEKAAVQLQHERLPSADDIDPWRAHWKSRLERLAALLAKVPPGN